MRHDGAAHIYGLAAALGAIAGARSATAPAAVSAALAARAYGRSPLLPGLLAAGAALGATFAWFHLRRLLMDELGMDGLSSGLVEDAAVATVAAALVRQA
jgi:hypothetical protein